MGCPIGCPGCFNPGTWSKDGGYEATVEDMVNRILNISDIEGVTFLGGEPFEQAEALADLGQKLRKAGLSVMTFTGYIIEDILNSTRKGWHDLLGVTDLLLDGPYIRDLTDTSRPWVGSSNQRYHFLTARYRHLESERKYMPNRLEIRLQPDGKIFVNGLASSRELHEIVGGLAKKVIEP
ncbi:MAG: radical SAM protein [Actinomycetota bacterium]|nr:radical SAM protein [Actinomycetota bacterium]